MYIGYTHVYCTVLQYTHVIIKNRWLRNIYLLKINRIKIYIFVTF